MITHTCIRSHNSVMLQAAQFLMKNTCFVDMKDASGMSALDIARKMKWPMLVRVLEVCEECRG